MSGQQHKVLDEMKYRSGGVVSKQYTSLVISLVSLHFQAVPNTVMHNDYRQGKAEIIYRCWNLQLDILAIKIN